MGRVLENTAQFSSLEDVLDDIYVRFIHNLPKEEKNTFERLGFQIEQAFWFYEDFFREPNAERLPKLTLPSFGSAMFQRFPSLLKPFGGNINKLFDNFFAYKSSIPTYGAIILNPDATKVFEEIGFEIKPFINLERFIEIKNEESKIRLYVVFNVSESTPFAPVSRKEISSISWHSINDVIMHTSSSLYFNVKPFIRKLVKFVKLSNQHPPQAIPQTKTIELFEMEKMRFLLKIKEFITNYPRPF